MARPACGLARLALDPATVFVLAALLTLGCGPSSSHNSQTAGGITASSSPPGRATSSASAGAATFPAPPAPPPPPASPPATCPPSTPPPPPPPPPGPTGTEFQNAVDYADPNAFPARQVVIGDLNGDGRPDLAVVNSYSLSVYMGNGDGTFQNGVVYTVGDKRFTTSVAIGDLNGDGKLDLVVVDFVVDENTNPQGAGSATVLIGNGDGTFQPPVHWDAGADPTFVVIGDLNGDGKPDLVVANGTWSNRSGTFTSPGGLSVLIGNGDGTFKAPTFYQGTQVFEFALVIGDVNGDGKPDIVAVNENGFANSASVSVRLGNGDGTFQAARDFPAGAYGGCLAIGDLNGDGKLDLVVNDAGNNVLVLLGNGDGTFQPGIPYASGAGPHFVAIGDVNGDGKPDLVVASYDGRAVSVLLGNGDGTFPSFANYPLSGTPLGVAIGDLNGDGKPDIVAADGNNVSVLLAK